MNIFLNEESLHGQYADVDAFSESLKNINAVLERFRELNLEKLCHRESTLFTKPAIGAQVFAAALSHIRDKSIRTQFFTLIDQLAMTSWVPTRVHTEGPYLCFNQDTTNTSVAESAERVRLDRVSILITFGNSIYAIDSIPVEIANSGIVSITSVTDIKGFLAFFQSHKEYGVVSYDKSSHAHPRDSQTVLTRRSRFKATSMRNHGQTIYLEISTGRYWCVDAKHFGQSAHLEVFDGLRKHISKANLDGTLIPKSGQGWGF